MKKVNLKSELEPTLPSLFIAEIDIRFANQKL